MKHRYFFSTLFVLLLYITQSFAQTENINQDESKVAPYQLPDPLVFNNGKPVRNAREWTKRRRPEILEIFSSQMYGHIPSRPLGEHFETIKQETVLSGMAVRKIVRIYLDSQQQHWFDVLVHLPVNASGPVPMFVGLNFQGNDATLDERASKRWPYEIPIKEGFGVATIWRDAVEPDGADSHIRADDDICRDGGVRNWYNPGGDWGAISAWAWGLSRVMDYFETDPAINSKKVAVLGHSRLGKTALWAGANDPRFAIVISNCSGCCGAAISRRVFGENFEFIDTVFPHWFTREFDKYKGHEELFPADQHFLAALIAPRPLYIASATEDLWADPKGEWLCASLVTPVYALFKKQGVDASMPLPDVPDNDADVAYHIHTGEHGISLEDWIPYVQFAKRHFSE